MRKGPLLEQLRELDIQLTANDDRLIVDAPKGVLTTELRETLLSHKPELLVMLRAPQEVTPGDLPVDWWVEWEERAAIREYDGGQAREHAEAEALREIVARMRAAGDIL